ncbi:MAG: flagellar alpha dynein, partial [Microcoleus sp.]
MLQSELVAIRTDRPEIQESVPAVADFPEPSDLLNQLRTRRKKSRTDLADMQTVLDILSNLKE